MAGQGKYEHDTPLHLHAVVESGEGSRTDIAARPAMQHVIITGRGAPEAVIEAADTVSRIDDVKHAFRAGIRAQKGIEL